MAISSSSVSESRIQIIDGFRCMAVLSVILYHFYFRFAPPATVVNWYPYSPLRFFQMGFYGVQMFFVISGFVIFQSMDSTTNAWQFLIKRIIRLLPAMIVCSIITYGVVIWLDVNHHFPENWLNFLFSVTFIKPEVWRAILHTPDINYIDGAYWSLWTEVVFYFAAASVFFLFSRRSFLRNWLTVVFILQTCRVLTSPKLSFYLPEQINAVFAGYYAFFFFFNLDQWIYFSLGIFFYSLYRKDKIHLREKVAMLVLTALEMFFLPGVMLRIFFLAILFVFLIFIYRPQLLSFLKLRIVVTIGLISYPLYLIHENVGILLIENISRIINYSPFDILIPIVVLVFFIYFCYGIFTRWEKPAIKYLKSIFLSPH